MVFAGRPALCSRVGIRASACRGRGKGCGCSKQHEGRKLARATAHSVHLSHDRHHGRLWTHERGSRRPAFSPHGFPCVVAAPLLLLISNAALGHPVTHCIRLDGCPVFPFGTHPVVPARRTGATLPRSSGRTKIVRDAITGRSLAGGTRRTLELDATLESSASVAAMQ